MKNEASCTLAHISLGSNLGDGLENLRAAAAWLDSQPGILVARVSPVYLTEPQGLRDQPFFTNQAALLYCMKEITAETLLSILLEGETALGRTRTGPRFGPRVIDIDLLLFGDLQITTERLTVPHPRMLERAFVLLPLADIAPDMILPGGGSVAKALGALHYRCESNVIFQAGPNPFES